MDKIFFLGAGRMAAAIAAGLAKSLPACEVTAYDPAAAACDAFNRAIGSQAAVTTLPSESADVVVLAVKPQYLAEAVKPLAGSLKDKLIISIVAGIPLARLAELTGAQRIVRVMPNTPALIGAGVSAYCASKSTQPNDAAIAESIFGAVGTVLAVDERLLDAVTGVSGCGPAYVFDFIMGLMDGGIRKGLPANVALKLAAETVAGAAKMAAECQIHPAELRQQVISPGGATAVGCAELERNAFRSVVAEAVCKATERAEELGKK